MSSEKNISKYLKKNFFLQITTTTVKTGSWPYLRYISHWGEQVAWTWLKSRQVQQLLLSSEMMMQRDTTRDYTLTEHAQSDNVFVQC